MIDNTGAGRGEEMPGEEGYPAYLASRLAEFYARAGRVATIGSEERRGSVAVIGAVSPPGGDFSEPVTENTIRLTRVFWALDFSLAHRRHFPAINWFMSYSEYIPMLEQWYESVGADWRTLREQAMTLLKEEEELREVVSLVGADILGGKQRCIFEAVKMLKEYFLLQSAFHAPSGRNDRRLSFSVINRREVMDRFRLQTYEGLSELVKNGELPPGYDFFVVNDKFLLFASLVSDYGDFSLICPFAQPASHGYGLNQRCFEIYGVDSRAGYLAQDTNPVAADLGNDHCDSRVLNILFESLRDLVSQLKDRQSFNMKILDQGQRNLAVRPDRNLAG